MTTPEPYEKHRQAHPDEFGDVSYPSAAHIGDSSQNTDNETGINSVAQKPEKPKIPGEIWVLVAAALLIAAGYGLIAPIIPQFAQSFNVGLAAAGAVVSIFAFTRLIFGPASGPLIDIFGSRKMCFTGLFVVAITTGAVAFTQEYWHVLLLRGLAGFGSTLFTVSTMGMIVRIAPPAIRGRCSSAYSSAFLLGNIVGPVVGSLMAPLGMRLPFVIYGIALLCAIAVVWWFTTGRSIRRSVPQDAAAGPTHAPSTDTQAPMSVKEAFTLTSYRAVLVSGFANGWANFGVRVATLPLFAAATFDNGGTFAAGFALASFAGGNAVCLQFSGRIADSIGRKPLIITGLIINAGFTACLGLSSSVVMFCVLSAFAGVGAGMLNPAQQAVVADVIGNDRSGGRVLAGFQMAQDFGSILGPIVVGAIAQTWSFEIGFILTAVVGLGAALQWCAAPDTLHRTHASR